MLIVIKDCIYKKLDGISIKLKKDQAIDMGAYNNANMIDKKIVNIKNPERDKTIIKAKIKRLTRG